MALTSNFISANLVHFLRDVINISHERVNSVASHFVFPANFHPANALEHVENSLLIFIYYYNETFIFYVKQTFVENYIIPNIWWSPLIFKLYKFYNTVNIIYAIILYLS